MVDQSKIPSFSSRRKKAVLATLMAVAACASVDAFFLPEFARRFPLSKPNPSFPSSRCYETGGIRDDNVAVRQSRKSRRTSPLQVRKRVRDVLERARTRTGIENASSRNYRSVVADAASIGGYVDNSTTNGSTSVNGSSEDTKVDANANPQQFNGSGGNESSSDMEALKGDIPAASNFPDPLPFDLPDLSAEQIRRLQSGERIQEQSRMGREGSGYVVLDVKAPPYVVWECLLDFESYPETIPTVRDMQLYTSEKLNYGFVNEKPVLPGTGRETRHYGTPSITRAAFVLSKFRLNIAAIHKYSPHPLGDYMEFTLDPSCTNMVLKGAKGIWYTQENPDGRSGYTRVYLLCEVRISRALPTFIVDYAADRAMPRATTWLKPQVEAAADLWLKPRSDSS